MTMSLQDAKAAQDMPYIPTPGALRPYERLCCLLLLWEDGTKEKRDQLQVLQSVLHDKYGAFITVAAFDHKDLEDSERSYIYVVENFVKENDSRKNLLVIIYSGCSYVHQGQLFLEPHQHTEPTVQWSDYVDRRILSTVSKVLLIFDTTNLRHAHYTQMFKETSHRLERSGYRNERNVLDILAINGLRTYGFTEALVKAAEDHPDRFAIEKIQEIMRTSLETGHLSPMVQLYTNIEAGVGTPEDERIVLSPLARPKLQLHGHHIFLDPHNEYLANYTTIQRDGACHVIKTSLGPDRQAFSLSACVVAVKQFTIRPRNRGYLREDFLRERTRLVEVSQWNHPHILGMLATFETRCEKFESLNIVLPFAGGGNLYDFLRIENDNRWHQRSYPVSDPSMPGSLADWRYAVYRETAGIADALKVLHENRNGTFIMHCDIKPANILIQKGVFKLADFGLSKLKDSEDSSKTDWYRGTALYSPPERESSTGVGRGRDVWAFGCVLLEIALMIRFAFQREAKFISPDVNNYIDSFELERRRHSRQHGDIETAIYHKTMVCVRWEMNRFDGMRPGLRHRITRDGLLPIIRDMLQEDPRNRCTAAEAAARLSSHYLGLQSDTQLQRPFEYQDNPGGPPADWDGRHSYGSEDNSNPRRSAILQNPEYGPYSRPELLRTATAPAGTSGSGDEMVAMDVEGVKRPASSTEPKSHPPPFQNKEHSSIDIFLRPNINMRHSSMGDESAAKRRRIDDTN